MGLPGHRRSSSHKRRRAAHFGLTSTNTVVCSHCGSKRLRHHACPKCGYYRGRAIVVRRQKSKKA
ncbi:50S ribosomal protein L32 [Candidatus Uhrbacteria bacterium]|nr:50S ribosomal protein L32 [Candidatus Uhrbacteria bacterium]